MEPELVATVQYEGRKLLMLTFGSLEAILSPLKFERLQRILIHSPFTVEGAVIVGNFGFSHH